ncbi:MAG: MFS transporter [Acidimicrobiales bacterium]
MTHAAAAPRTGVLRAFESFSAPHFGKVYAGGFVWSVCRWALGFLGAYVVNKQTGSPRLVQLTGSFLWAPLLFAGLIGGAVSDRFDRRKVVLAQFAVLMPLTAAVGLLALADRLSVWILYPFMVTIGVGWVIDMTVRRALIYDLVGDAQVNNAMALEQFASSAGLAIGALSGGAVIGWLGVGQAYLAAAAAMGVALVVLARLPSPPPRPRAAAGGPSFFRSVAEGFRALPANPTLLSVLGVTLIVNFFHFSYFPIVPIVAAKVDATPFLTGLLAAATGLGMMTGALFVMMRAPQRGRAYCLGSYGAFVLLLGFAGFDRYLLVFGSLYLASVFVGAYGATQSSLVITSSSEEMRGRAMGLLSMAIGGLPVGMEVLGELAELLGAGWALAISNVVGVAVLALFLRRRPEAYRVS